MINIQALLGDLGVTFWSSGKNVSEGWTTISCPMCGDRSNHGGFDKSGQKYSCFRCGKHSIKTILAQFAPYPQVEALISEYSNILYIPNQQEAGRAARVDWPPKETLEVMPSIHAQYLFNRGYDPRQIRELYDVRCQYQTGKMKYRLIIPVYYNGRIVTYVGRDVTEKAHLRYKNLAESQSILPAKECVYNIDAVFEYAVITEGIFDAWRFGAHGVALFGIQFTSRQTHTLASKLKRASIVFDAEPQAQSKANELAEILSFQGVDVEILLLDRGDPGEMSQEEADEIKREIL